MELALGDLTVRPLSTHDAGLLVEATQAESGAALWGPRPLGPYTRRDASTALHTWETAGQTSFGIMVGAQLVGALGLMPDGPGSAELAYWIRPEHRGQGIAARSLRALTTWARADGRSRLWLEINPTNAASLKVAERAGFRFEQRIPNHCRQWLHDDPDQDQWHDCLIWHAS